MNLSRWTTLGLALAALGLGAGCQRSNEQYESQSSKEGSSGASTQASQEVQGTVKEKSGDKLEVSDASGQEHTVKTDDKTQVFVGGQKTSGLGQIQEGSQIRASFPQKGEKEPALRIEVIEPGGASQGGGTVGGQGSSGAGTGSQGGSQGTPSGTQGGSQGTQGGGFNQPSGAGQPGTGGSDTGSSGGGQR